MKKALMALAFLGAWPLAAAADVTKEDIKKLAAAGISEDVILSYIRQNGPVAKMSADDLIELKQAGVSDKVLGALTGASPAPAAKVVEKKETVVVPQTTVVYDTPRTYYVPSYSYYAPSYSYGTYCWSHRRYGCCTSTYWSYPYYSSYSYNYCYPRSYYYSYPRYSYRSWCGW